MITPRKAADVSALDEFKLNLRIVWPLLRNIAEKKCAEDCENQQAAGKRFCAAP
jgi:hypothetical protein